jgi:hypothetical protein
MQIDWTELPEPTALEDLIGIFGKALPNGLLVKVQINMERWNGLQLETATIEDVWLIGDVAHDGYSGCDINEFRTRVLAYSTSLCNLIDTAKQTTKIAPPTPWKAKGKPRERVPLEPEAEAIKQQNMQDRSEIHELELILTDVPSENAIERLGLEERIETIKNNIAKRTIAYVKKTFY